MSVSVTVNGTTYTIPQTGETGWGANVTSWIQGVSNGTLQKSGGSFTLTAEVDFGATYGIKVNYIKSQTSNVASTGVIRLARADIISWRDQANANDLELGVDSSDRLTFNGNPIVPSSALTASRALQSDASGVVSTSSVTSTELGYVSGVTSAIQTQLDSKITENVGAIVNADVNASAAIDRSKLATGNASHVLVNNGSGVMFSEAQLDKSRGGTGINSTATFPTSGVIVTETASATLTNKTLTSPSMTDPTVTSGALTLPEIATPSTPASGFGKAYFKSDGKLYQLNDDGTETQVGSGGSSGINYISANPDAESSTTGWATYKDAAASTPVDGTGGSATLTFTRSTSSPLRGTASFLVTTTAANLQGEGASYDFTLSSADQAKVMSISFDYNIASGTYVTGDMAVYIYDVTNATVIQPAGYQIQAVGSTLPNKHIATFQTSSNSTSYRLIFHRAVSTASAMTMKIDNVQLGPQVVQYGAPVTDWQSYTPTITNGGTTSTNTGKWRRVGDSIELQTLQIFSGAGSAANLLIAPPTGITFDTTKTNGLNNVGAGSWFDASANQEQTGTSVAVSSTNVGVFIDDNGGTIVQGNQIASGDYIRLQIMLPVVGWSSTVQMSNDTDTRVVAFSTKSVTTGTLTHTATGTFQNLPSGFWGTPSVNTHGGWDASTNGGQYTIQVSGLYRITLIPCFDVSATGVRTSAILVDGSTVARSSDIVTNASSSSAPMATTLVSLNAGQIVRGQAYQNSGGNLNYYVGNSGVYNIFSIERLSGPSAIAASELVAARVASTDTTSIAGSSTSTIVWNSTTFDTHGSVASNKFTAVTSGKFRMNVMLSFNASTNSVNQYIQIIFRKNGTTTVSTNGFIYQTTSSIFTNIMLSDVISLNAGDYIEVRLNNQTGSSKVPNGVAAENYWSIERIGN